MQELTDLYRAVVLDHRSRPRNIGRLAHPTHNADGHNPLCGDHVHVDLEVAGDVLRDVRFEGEGCAISTASASMMTESLKGRTLAQVRRLLDGMDAVCTGQPANGRPGDLAVSEPASGEQLFSDGRPLEDALEALTAFEPVRQYPVRVKCATLAWDTTRRALGIGRGRPR